MIPKTVVKTKKSTFEVLVPNPTPNTREFPTPYGTGFFISADGYFLTAQHVITYSRGGTQTYFDPNKIMLNKPEILEEIVQIKGLKFIKDWATHDLALFKVDFDKTADLKCFKGKAGLIS